VDGALRTSRRGVFAAGNVLHAVERAATAAREGAWVADAVRASLVAASWPPGVPLTVDPPLRWITPNRVTPADALPYTLRTAARLSRPLLEVTQDGRVLHRERVHGAAPDRSLTLTARWVHAVDPKGGPVRVAVG
jgi:hypothetical protein